MTPLKPTLTSPLDTLPPAHLRLGMGLLVLCALFSTTQVRSAEPTANATVSVAATSGATVVNPYQVQKGDTLDKLLGHYYKGSPLKVEVLRKAVLAANPSLAGSKTPRLKPGSALQMPDHGQLMWATLAPYVPEQIMAAQANSNTLDPTAQRNWVRYP